MVGVGFPCTHGHGSSPAPLLLPSPLKAPSPASAPPQLSHLLSFQFLLPHFLPRRSSHNPSYPIHIHIRSNVQARVFNPKKLPEPRKKDPGETTDRDISQAKLKEPCCHRPAYLSARRHGRSALEELAEQGRERRELLRTEQPNRPIEAARALVFEGSDNAADLVDAAGPGPFHVSGKGEEGRRGGAGHGAAHVGHALGRGLRDFRRRLLPTRREGHQPGLLHRMGGIRVPGRLHLLRHLRRARPVGPLRRQGRPGFTAAFAALPLAGGRRAGVAHRRRREEALRLPVRPVEAVLPGRRRRGRRRAPPKPPPRRIQQRVHRAVHRQAGRHDGGFQRRRLAGRPWDHVGRRGRRRRPAHRRLQAQLTPGEGAHQAVQGPGAQPRRRARRAPGVAAGPGRAGTRHVAGVRRLLRQGLRRDLRAGGDAEEGHRPGPVRHPGHRRGLGRALQRGGRAHRGRDAGQREGGEAPGRVRRARVAAQAEGHRRRRLLRDLPLPPLAGVLKSLSHCRLEEENARTHSFNFLADWCSTSPSETPFRPEEGAVCLMIGTLQDWPGQWAYCCCWWIAGKSPGSTHLPKCTRINDSHQQKAGHNKYFVIITFIVVLYTSSEL